MSASVVQPGPPTPLVTRVLTMSLWLLAGIAVASPWLVSSSSETPVLWWAARAFGFVGYVALWVAMLSGVLIGAKGVDGVIDRKVLLDIHQQWTLAAVLATAAHVLAVITNPHAGVGLVGSLVPFASPSMTAAIGLGVVAFWMLALVAVSSWLRTRVPYAAWRAVHALAFGAFILALIHSAASGTDSATRIAQWLYVSSGSIVAGAVTVRMLFAAGSHSR